ncbi:MAG: hybrid sensor histidine kinase/response regulator [Magnetospirillum sp.]|nr:hybrid sensor histidine kinase/response regulator [Magnetospirillum sp.]
MPLPLRSSTTAPMAEAAAPQKLRLRRRQTPEQSARESWVVLVVDDDPQVREMTQVLLRDFRFEGRAFDMLSAASAAGAALILAQRPDIPVVLLDVVMETPDAGLGLVRYIRDELNNRTVRIILRTGQPGDAPEREVVVGYDVNDYKSKAELTAQKLFTALVGALRAWRDIVTIERLNRQLVEANSTLEARVERRTAELMASREALARAKERTEAALARETEAKHHQRQFLSMVSHEFRTPLAIIDSAAQILALRAGTADESSQRRLDTIRGSVQRLIGLIDTCLADEQLESGTIALREQAFDMAEMLGGVVANQRAANPSREIRLAAPSRTPAWGDPEMLALAVGNLIGNAVKYSPEDQPVEVAAGKHDGGVAVTVADHGIGIPSDDIPNLFKRFHRAPNARGVPGSGIGLHMVRQIADLHGGTVSVDSGVGRGSVFTLCLPRTSPGKRQP